MNIHRVAIVAAGCVCAAASPAAAEIDGRCRAYDRAITEKVKSVLDLEDMKSTAYAYAVVQRLTSARMLCAEARTAAALSAYEQLQQSLDRNPAARRDP
jgi:hypothetical protein